MWHICSGDSTIFYEIFSSFLPWEVRSQLFGRVCCFVHVAHVADGLGQLCRGCLDNFWVWQLRTTMFNMLFFASCFLQVWQLVVSYFLTKYFLFNFGKSNILFEWWKYHAWWVFLDIFFNSYVVYPTYPLNYQV